MKVDCARQKNVRSLDYTPAVNSILEGYIYGAARHQMSGAEEQDLSTGQPKKDLKR